MCIHDALTKIILEHNLEVFIEFTSKRKNQNFDNCKCLNYFKNIELFSLFKSIEKCDVEIFKYLLRANLVNKEDNNKYTPLHLAARNGHKEIVEILLNYKADPNKENNDKDTPLHLAARYDRKEIVEILLNHKADPNKENNYKETPLHLAARYDRKEIVEILLNYKADPNKENNYKNTPLHWASHQGHKEIVEILYKVADTKYKSDETILKFIKKHNLFNKMSSEFFTHIILQSYEFDNNSLFSKDYLCRDMLFLILKRAKNEQLLNECEEMV